MIDGIYGGGRVHWGVLRKIFGFNGFQEGNEQESVIQAILPTGMC